MPYNIEIKPSGGGGNTFRTFTPSDTARLPLRTEGVFIGDVSGGSNLAIEDHDGNQVILFVQLDNVPVPIRGARFIRATGTTASNLVIWYVT